MDPAKGSINPTSFSFCSCRSRLIFSSSRISSAASSSSSSLRSLVNSSATTSLETTQHGTTNLSSSLLSESDPTESASISRVSSNIRRRFASASSSSRLASTSSSRSRLSLGTGSVGASSWAPLVLEKCAASAANNSALRSRGWSASPPWPGCLPFNQLHSFASFVFFNRNLERTGLSSACKQARVAGGRPDHEGPLCLGPVLN